MKYKPTYEELENEVERLHKKNNTSENKIKFDSYFEHNKMAMLQIDLATKQIINANTAAIDFYGYLKTELIQKKICDLHTLSASEVDSLMKEATKSKSSSFECIHKLASGKLRNVQIFLSNVSFEKMSTIVITINDITESKLAEEKIQLVSSRNEALLDAIPDIIMEVDSNKIYTWANKQGLEFFGDDVIGKEASYYFEGEQNTYEEVSPLFENTKNIIYVESWQRNKAGEKRLLAWLCRILKDKNGIIIGSLSSAQDITKRNKSEQILKESEANLSSLINNRNEHIWSIDKNKNLITFNNQFKEAYLASFNIELKQGLNVLEILTPDLLAFWKPKYESVFSGERLVFEFSNSIENELHFYEVSLNPIILDGKITGVSALSVDITERQQVKKEMKMFTSSIANINECVSLTDSKNNIIFVNDAFLKTYGYTKSELMGKNISIVRPKDTQSLDSVKNILKETLKGGWKGEIINQRKDGTLFPVYISTSIIQDDEGNTLALIGITTDITKRKKIENELKISEQRYRILAENANDVIWTMNLEGRFTYVSPSVKKLRGYTVTEIMNQQLNESFTPNHLEIAKKLLGEAVESVKSRIPVIERFSEFEQPCKDGSTVWIEATMSIIHDEEGEFVSILGITRDISERKRNEQIQNILLNIANAVFTTDNVSELIGFIRKELNTLIDTTNLFVAMYDKKTDSFTLPYHEDEFDDFSSFPADKTVTAYVVETGKSLLANLDSLKKLEKTGKIGRHGADSLCWLGVPLKDDEQIIGAIVTQSYTDEHAFNETDKDLLEIISIHISLAINRKNTEIKLHESEFRFKALHNATFGGIMIHDKGLILDCNQGLANISGYTVEELIGMNGLLLIAEQSHDNVMKNILSAYEKPYEAVGLCKNGRKYPLRIESKNIPYKGKIVRTTEFRDITEQKNTELEIINAKEKAVESKEKFKLLNSLTSEMLLLQDLDSIYKFIIENLQKQYKDTIITYVSIDESNKKTRFEALSGLDNKLFKKIRLYSNYRVIYRYPSFIISSCNSVLNVRLTGHL